MMLYKPYCVANCMRILTLCMSFVCNERTSHSKRGIIILNIMQLLTTHTHTHSAERAPPEGAYNRTADMKNQPADRRSRSPSPFNSFVNR